MLFHGSLSQHVFLALRAWQWRLRLLRRIPSRPLPQILAELTPDRLPRKTMSAEELWPILRVVEAVCRRSRVLPDTCLYRALTRYALLRQMGHPAKFVMGMDPRAREDLTAHAWVELDGAPYRETLDPRLVVTYVYPDDLATAKGTSSTL